MSRQLLDQSAIVMSYLLIIIALLISATRTLTFTVRLSQAQALVLTSVMLITAFQRTLFALGLLAILPLMLAAFVPRLLARATLHATSEGHDVTSAQTKALIEA